MKTQDFSIAAESKKLYILAYCFMWQYRTCLKVGAECNLEHESVSSISSVWHSEHNLYVSTIFIMQFCVPY